MIERYSIGAAACVDVTWDIDAACLRFTPVRMTGRNAVNHLGAHVIGMPRSGPWREATQEIRRVLRLYKDDLAALRG